MLQAVEYSAVSIPSVLPPQLKLHGFTNQVVQVAEPAPAKGVRGISRFQLTCFWLTKRLDSFANTEIPSSTSNHEHEQGLSPAPEQASRLHAVLQGVT